MREIAKLAGVLFVITALAAVILGFTNIATAEKIEAQVEQENLEARQEALPIADTFEEVTDSEVDNALKTPDFSSITEVYVGKKGEEIVGYTLKSTPAGYGGEVVLITGISVEGKVTGIKVVSHQETPGLGANATNPEFQNKYIDKSIDQPLAVVKTAPSKDNEIEAITGATITSSAVTTGVNTSIDLYHQYLK
ncbi:RnfABCDGE type electron transport complex subunit G [Irregularibacter muris]|uniref:Ion-translocating oxidoreductase complex subunit G n=1 Tax=Irregularibacter muris TaxID=1796619 RepID=A0AAE3HGS2_9FIRM|nr:RnfABCDGE type electron transport complex subunit G [Irregularibacter muris]MCR1899891.1 RnfABCDGE type electron transport complex subunit G [Irregularibacter muris]